MPNWCRGSLTVRGTKGNVKRFLIKSLNTEDDIAEIYEDDEKLIIRSNHKFYIKGTNRNLIEDDIEFNFGDDRIIKQCSLECFMAAWVIDPEPYVQLAKEYEIDINIGVVEIYMGFTQEIKIQNGEIIIDKMEKINLDFRDGDEEEDPSSYNKVLSLDYGKPSVFIDADDDLPF